VTAWLLVKTDAFHRNLHKTILSTHLCTALTV